MCFCDVGHMEQLQYRPYGLLNLLTLQKKFADPLRSNHGNLISHMDEWFGNEHKM